MQRAKVSECAEIPDWDSESKHVQGLQCSRLSVEVQYKRDCKGRMTKREWNETYKSD